MGIPLNKQDRLKNSLLLNIQSSNDYCSTSAADVAEGGGGVPIAGAGRLSSLQRACVSSALYTSSA